MGEPSHQLEMLIQAPNLGADQSHLNSPANKPTSLPPMLVSYLDYKRRYPDAHLLFQVGDFYEVFFEDATVVARTLNLTLTSRDKSSPNPIPMCGVPVSVADGYVDRLVAAGFSVAVVSQDGPPQDGKGMMQRRLERIVTPGVDILGGGGRAARVGALVGSPERGFSLCFTDVTSARLWVREQLDTQELISEVTRAQVSELVLPIVFGQLKIDRRLGWVKALEHQLGAARLKMRSLAENPSQKLHGIDGFPTLPMHSKLATSLLVDYIDETTPSTQLRFRSVAPHTYDDVVSIDAATRRTLELLANARDGSTTGTLLSVIDRTATIAGQRLLRHWIVNPLLKRSAIETRQQAVAFLIEHQTKLTEIRHTLTQASDCERIATRVELAVAGPRELAALRETLEIAQSCAAMIKSCDNLALQSCAKGLRGNETCLDLLRKQLHASPPMQLRDGEVIASGVDAELDRLRDIKARGHAVLAELEGREKEASGISNLRIRFNNQLGYFFEVTKAQRSRVPAHFEARQSTTSGDRFVTGELKKLEEELFSVDGKIATRESALYRELLQAVAGNADALRVTGEAIAELDCFCSLALVAAEQNWCQPTLDEDANAALNIKAGRHPVLSVVLREQFVPNSLTLGGEKTPHLLVVTGPNMGGKSTFLRQAAHIVILAQLGSFVPAESATISIVDAVFARLGASDNISEGESTFMVEMREASLIVSQATPRSLVLIDEIGRGTATADGLALAQAILEWLLVKTRCRTLFATHFHELTDLQKEYPELANCSVSSVERGENVHFTHEIVPGPASRSYGIEVAQTAGMPAELITRARTLLSARVRQSLASEGKANFPKFDPTIKEAATAKKVMEQNKVIEQIKSIDPNSTTPLEALGLLSKLHAQVVKISNGSEGN